MGERLETIDAVVEQYCVASSSTKSRLYTALGLLFVVFAILGIWIPGWPTVSWAVPAAFLFSYSSEKMFRWTLTNRYFGSAMFEYYATGKTVPQHAKNGIMAMITVMTVSSATFVWYVSTLGEGDFVNPSTWDGADPGYGAATILFVGCIGVWWLYAKVETRK